MKGFDYVQVYYYKWVISYGKTISEYNVKRGGLSKILNFGCFFIWSIECVEKTDSAQLITRTHFDAITQINVSLACCHLNSFLAIIIFTHEERLGVC